ncbi:MAG TPA: hypothetical protein VHX52_03760 [Steroidobacteraceae bacterium]|jgi:hypothetical protein|nr:hypothetical protein [Steroidobacteraceae bacterium]
MPQSDTRSGPGTPARIYFNVALWRRGPQLAGAGHFTDFDHRRLRADQRRERYLHTAAALFGLQTVLAAPSIVCAWLLQRCVDPRG